MHLSGLPMAALENRSKQFILPDETGKAGQVARSVLRIALGSLFGLVVVIFLTQEFIPRWLEKARSGRQLRGRGGENWVQRVSFTKPCP